jgi:hypothetical protein
MAKRLRSEREEIYARVWNAVRGGIRDFRNAHPDEIMPFKADREASLIKRIVGQIESMAGQLSEEPLAENEARHCNGPQSHAWESETRGVHATAPRTPPTATDEVSDG